MSRTSFKKVLFIASDVFPEQLITEYAHIKHVKVINGIFPAIFDQSPDLIIFDYDFVGNEMEKVLRRIKVNKFYQKIKICCYKASPNEKTDSLLKVLGVDEFIYESDLLKKQKNKPSLSLVNTVIDASILKWIAGASN